MGWKTFIALAFMLAFSAAHMLNESNTSNESRNLATASKLVYTNSEGLAADEWEQQLALEKYFAATVMTLFAGAGMYTTLMALVFLASAFWDACHCWMEKAHEYNRH